MRNILFSIFAIAVASVAAMTATTALLNAPQRGGQATVTTANVDTPAGTPPATESKPAPGASGTAGTPGASPDAKSAGGAANPAAADGKTDEEADKDPYEGIAEEELPPDLQYSADSSVSFPTNI
jgi:hypothetical protein